MRTPSRLLPLLGLLAAACLTVPIATQTVPPGLLPVLLALAGAAGEGVGRL